MFFLELAGIICMKCLRKVSKLYKISRYWSWKETDKLWAKNACFIFSLESYSVSRRNLVKCHYDLQQTFLTFFSSRPFLSFQAVMTSFKFFIIFNLYTVAIKIVKHQLLNMNQPHDISTFWKSWKDLELVSRLQNWTKTNIVHKLY